jgi:hypothetical protein
MTNTHKADALGWGRISGFGIEQTPPYALVGLQRIEKELIELRARVEALEAQQQPQDKLDRLIAQDRAASDAPQSDELVRRVAQRLAAVFEDGPYVKGAARWDKTAARAAIREVAAWFTTIAPHGSEAWRMASEVLLQEASRD